MLDFLTHNYYAAYGLVIVAVIFAFIMSANVKGTFAKYNKIRTKSGQTAASVARQILDSNGLYNVDVVAVAGNLTDHYDPKQNVVALSASVYDSATIGAVGVAAHEVGHAIQHAEGYIPIKIRNVFYPVAQIGSNAWLWLFILGMVLSIYPLIYAGIIFFAFVVVFQLVTLPVEFNASRRAISTIEQQFLLERDEIGGAKKTLSAAAMTYVASLAVSIAQLLRLIASANRRR